MNKPGIKIKKLPRIKAKPRTSETVKSENQTRNSTKTAERSEQRQTTCTDSAERHKDTFKRRKKRRSKQTRVQNLALIPCQYNEKTRIPSELLFIEKLHYVSSVFCFLYVSVFLYIESN
jgi:hypothetical protein